jgi:hypothetical protein
MAENASLLFLFVAANLAITAGYFLLAFAVVPQVRIQLLRTKIGGIGFFLTCGLTHANMALQSVINHDHMSMAEMAVQWHMLAIHIPQAVAVWLFVTGIFIEMGDYGLLRLKDMPDGPNGGSQPSDPASRA